MSGMCVKPKRLRRLTLTDEFDERSILNANLMSMESAAKYRRTAPHSNTWRLTIHQLRSLQEEASRSMSSPRQGEEVKFEDSVEIAANVTYNDISTRLARSSSRIDWVHGH